MTFAAALSFYDSVEMGAIEWVTTDSSDHLNLVNASALTLLFPRGFILEDEVYFLMG